MITEYYTDNDLVKEATIISNRFANMLLGEFGDKLLKLFKKNKTIGGKATKTITYNKQNYLVTIIWDKNAYKTQDFYFNIETTYETKNGKMTMMFSDKNNPIQIASPHYIKRNKERKSYGDHFFMDKTKIIKYKRNGRDYELFDTNDNAILITRRSKENEKLFYLITFLTRDMCTNKNYKELFSRIDNQIDNDDVYNWK